jgi:hypothetical protein
MATPPTPLPRISPEAPGAIPPKKNQSILIWILSGCGTILVLLVIVGALAFRSFMKNVHVGPNGEVDMRFGGMSMHAGKAKDVGLPIYPGLDVASATGMEVTVPNKQTGPVSVTMAIYSSKDPVEKVDDWYHENLGPEFIRLDPGKNQSVLGDKAFPFPIDQGAIAYSCRRGDTMYAVTLHSIMGTSQIKLMRANAPTHQAQ